MPKKFGDLTKPVADLFKDDFSTDQSLKVTTKSSNGIELECEGKVSKKKGSSENVASGELTTSLNWLGLGFKETWKTNGTITTEVTKKDFVESKGSKAVIEMVMSPTDGLQEVTIKANVETGDFHADIKASGKDIPKKVVLGFVYSFLGNWSLGLKAASDDLLSSSVSVNKTVGVLYESDSKDLSIYSEVGLDDASLSGKVFHTPSNRTKFGAQIATQGSKTTLSAVGEYTLDDLTAVKASIDSGMLFKIASVHKVGAATISPSATVDFGTNATPNFGIGIKMKN